MEDNFTYEIIKKVVVLKEHESGWRKELNIVDWNSNGQKFDIRDWSPDYTKMSKGITLTKEEMARILDVDFYQYF